MKKFTLEGFTNIDGLFLAGSSILKDYFFSLYFVPQLKIKLIEYFEVQYGFQ